MRYALAGTRRAELEGACGEVAGEEVRVMGIGDNIMATADVRAINERTKQPVVVLGRSGKVIQSEIFQGNPRIAYTRVGAQPLMNGPGMRPYIAGRTDRQWTWRRMRDQQPGEIYLTAAEVKFAAAYAGMVLIEPNVKANGHTNKAWAFDRWQAVVDAMGVPMVQVGAPGTRWLAGVERVETPTFRHACAVLSVCGSFVGTEGALHHAAAALKVPAVVLWSHFIAPDITGYKSQVNIRHAGDPCGWRVPCKACAASMNAITVGEVVGQLKGIHRG
jgi:hypothetical protein